MAIEGDAGAGGGFGGDVGGFAGLGNGDLGGTGGIGGAGGISGDVGGITGGLGISLGDLEAAANAQGGLGGPGFGGGGAPSGSIGGPGGIGSDAAAAPGAIGTSAGGVAGIDPAFANFAGTDPGLNPAAGFGVASFGGTPGVSGTIASGNVEGVPGTTSDLGSGTSLASALAALNSGGFGLAGGPASFGNLQTESVGPGIVSVDNLAQAPNSVSDLTSPSDAGTNAPGPTSQEIAAALAALSAQQGLGGGVNPNTSGGLLGPSISDSGINPNTVGGPLGPNISDSGINPNTVGGLVPGGFTSSGVNPNTVSGGAPGGFTPAEIAAVNNSLSGAFQAPSAPALNPAAGFGAASFGGKGDLAGPSLAIGGPAYGNSPNSGYSGLVGSGRDFNDLFSSIAPQAPQAPVGVPAGSPPQSPSPNPVVSAPAITAPPSINTGGIAPGISPGVISQGNAFNTPAISPLLQFLRQFQSPQYA